MKRLNASEEMFKKRYGKDVEVYKEINLSDSGNIAEAIVTIKSKKTTYILTEIFKDGLTDYVKLSYSKDKEYKFPNYLSAEVTVADLIGEE